MTEVLELLSNGMTLKDKYMIKVLSEETRYYSSGLKEVYCRVGLVLGDREYMEIVVAR